MLGPWGRTVDRGRTPESVLCMCVEEGDHEGGRIVSGGAVSVRREGKEGR